MKIFEVAGEGKLHGLTVMSLDAFVKKEDDVEEDLGEGWKTGAAIGGTLGAMAAGPIGAAVGAGAGGFAQAVYGDVKKQLDKEKLEKDKEKLKNDKEYQKFLSELNILDEHLNNSWHDVMALYHDRIFPKNPSREEIYNDDLDYDKSSGEWSNDGLFNALYDTWMESGKQINQIRQDTTPYKDRESQIVNVINEFRTKWSLKPINRTKMADLPSYSIKQTASRDASPEWTAKRGKQDLSKESVKQGVAEGDPSGIMHAAKNYNRSFLITAELAEGGKKTFRVRAQSERVAREKFDQHYNQATIISVKEEGITEDVSTDAKVYQNKMTGKFVAWIEIGGKKIDKEGDTKEEALQNLIDHVESLKASRTAINSKWTVIGFTAGFVSLIKMSNFFAKFSDEKLLISDQPGPGYSPVSMSGKQVSPTGKFAVSDIQNAGLDISARYDIVSTDTTGEFKLKYHSPVYGTWDKDYRKKPSLTIQMAGRNLKEFALPGGNDGDSGRWYTDDELADIIGDDWFQDFDVSHDEFNIDAYGEKAKKNLASYANSWFDDKGYNVNVMGVDHNEVDHDLKWYIVGSFQNDNFADKDINEAPGDFGLGANYRAVPDDEMQAYMDRSKTLDKTKRDKFDYPYLHRSNIEIKDEAGKTYDTEALKKSITQRPKSILGQNGKMQHSATGDEILYNIGLPALKGLAVNEKTGQFVVVDTCPGAGACQTFCYAMRGSYVMFKAVSMNLARMLNYLLNDPDGFADQLDAEVRLAQSKNRGVQVVVRWHDAGDFFSPEYLDMAYKVARANPKVKFYAYTKMASAAQADRPANFNMNFSSGAKTGQEKKIDFQKVKHSRVIPNDLFWDLIVTKNGKPVKDEQGRNHFSGPEAFDTFKGRLAQKFKLDKDSIISYDQLMKTPLGDAPYWNVVVVPGDGDNSANRNDVIGSYLLFH